MNEKHPEHAGYLYQIQLALPRATRTRILFQPETKFCFLPRAINSIMEGRDECK